jgi:hypothetical protein
VPLILEYESLNLLEPVTGLSRPVQVLLYLFIVFCFAGFVLPVAVFLSITTL